MNCLRRQFWLDAGDSPAGTPNAAGVNEETPDAAGVNEGNAESGVSGEKSFTQTDVDRIVQQTIAKERRRADAAIRTARTEAERLAQMTAEQRAEHERQEREDALAKREAEITRRELRAQALETLAGRGLPRGLAEVLNYADAESCGASIDSVEKAFRAAVQTGVEERMKGQPPKASGGDSGAAFLAQLRQAAGLK